MSRVALLGFAIANPGCPCTHIRIIYMYIYVYVYMYYTVYMSVFCEMHVGFRSECVISLLASTSAVTIGHHVEVD